MLEEIMKKENNIEAQLFHFQEWLHSARMDADKVAPEKIRNIGEPEVQLCTVSALFTSSEKFT